MVSDAPHAVVAPTEVKFAIVVYGDNNAMLALKKQCDEHGGTTTWAYAGEPKTFYLYIAIDGPKPSTENRAFIDAVNRKEFGNLTAGFAEIGAGN